MPQRLHLVLFVLGRGLGDPLARAMAHGLTLLWGLGLLALAGALGSADPGAMMVFLLTGLCGLALHLLPALKACGPDRYLAFALLALPAGLWLAMAVASDSPHLPRAAKGRRHHKRVAS